jgi:hypothetical protein
MAFLLLLALVGCSEPSSGAPTATPASKPAVSPAASPASTGSPVAEASVVAPTEVVDTTVDDLTIGDVLEGGGGPRNVVQALNNKGTSTPSLGGIITPSPVPSP